MRDAGCVVRAAEHAGRIGVVQRGARAMERRHAGQWLRHLGQAPAGPGAAAGLQPHGQRTEHDGLHDGFCA
jgi:hypothetical protein